MENILQASFLESSLPVNLIATATEAPALICPLLVVFISA